MPLPPLPPLPLLPPVPNRSAAELSEPRLKCLWPLRVGSCSEVSSPPKDDEQEERSGVSVNEEECECGREAEEAAVAELSDQGEAAAAAAEAAVPA